MTARSDGQRLAEQLAFELEATPQGLSCDELAEQPIAHLDGSLRAMS